MNRIDFQDYHNGCGTGRRGSHAGGILYCNGSITVEDTADPLSQDNGTWERGFYPCHHEFLQSGLYPVGTAPGSAAFLHYFEQFQMLSTTGIDLPGEGATIMHQLKNVGPVELATISFGQSFQLTPIQMASTVSSLINGGARHPHIALTCRDRDGKVTRTCKTKDKGSVVSKETSEIPARVFCIRW